MITEEEKKIIKRCAEKYSVAEVYLFGSSLENSEDANDIDLAVKGIKPSLFFTFYGELISGLPKPVDLVDASEPSRFINFILRKAVRVS